MTDFLPLAQDLPRRSLATGEALIVDGTAVDELYVLIEGELRIEKSGVQIARFAEAGACVGEMSLLLGSRATADVVADAPTVVAVMENGSAAIRNDPELALALAQLLAAKLQVMTTYLVDIKQQYADHEGGLGMVDAVLGRLMQGGGTARTELRSERGPDPEF